MKKLSQILAVGVIALMPFVVSSSALAAGTCAIGYTGPDSNNQCISTTAYTCTVTNATTVEVTNDNTQISVTGDASGTGNGTSGSVSTGSATNSNRVTFNATVTNGTDGNLGVCTIVATVPATIASVTPPVVVQTVPAPAGGQGAASGLPNTSGDSVMASVAGVVGILGAGAVISRLAVMAYGRLKS
jgi:hypothetical protein